MNRIVRTLYSLTHSLALLWRTGRGRLFAGLAIALVVAWRLFVPLMPQGETLDAAHRSTSAAQATQTAQTAITTQAALALHVEGNRLVTASGHTVVLRGVNRDGTDYLCAEGRGIFDGPTGAPSIAAMQAWHINAVRLPLNEGCWLGQSGIPASMSGAAYQRAIAQYVATLTASGLYVVLDLHKVTPTDGLNSHILYPMPDAANAPVFWAQVAAQYRANGMVLFDLYNEPHDVDWACWRDGGAACGASVPYPAVGMQSLLQVVRGAGAHNVVLAAGVHWADDLNGWLPHAPSDPLHNLAASWHVYMEGTPCADPSCYTQTVGPVAAQVPVVAGEFGTDIEGLACRPSDVAGVERLLQWLDQENASYLAFSWNVGRQDCGALSLIATWGGSPHAPNGTAYRAHLLALPPQP